MGFRRHVAGLCLLIVASPALARAQAFEAPRLTIGASAGVSDPLHGDWQFVAPSWDLGVRGQVAPHFIVEAFASQWRHTTKSVRTGLPVTGVNGPLGRIGQMMTDDQTLVDVAGVSFLPALTTGRLTVAGGGGPALMVLRHNYAQRFANCEPASLCRDYENQHTATTFAVALAGSVDVRLASWLTAFGQFRTAVPTEDPGSGHVAATAGVRVVIR
jgi:hypothetical protein